MSKVVYMSSQDTSPTKRYIVQFRFKSFPQEGWHTYDRSFDFKWVAINYARLAESRPYEHRVVDTRD